jgi:hypothetical protein
MNAFSRSIVIAISLALCAGGLIATVREASSRVAEFASGADIVPRDDYRFASTDLHNFSFAELEAIVRADAATRFPNSRMELGSVKAEQGLLTMTVVFFGAHRQTEAFLYSLVPKKNSWKISNTRRLWFVPVSQIARGLQV